MNRNALLTSDEVHIWSVRLSDNEMNVNYFFPILSEDELERASSFKFLKDQKQFIIARGILRCLLAGYLEEPPQAIEIMYGLWGKPCLSQEQSIHFNISHSGEYALYAVTLDYEVGIDLEYIDKDLELADMALSILSPSELAHWKNLDLEVRVNSFFNHWVCKEAFLKASGKGWLQGEEEMSLKTKGELRKDFSNHELTYPYCFECIPGYASALFIKGPHLRRLHYSWDQNNLQEKAQY